MRQPGADVPYASLLIAAERAAAVLGDTIFPVELDRLDAALETKAAVWLEARSLAAPEARGRELAAAEPQVARGRPSRDHRPRFKVVEL